MSIRRLTASAATAALALAGGIVQAAPAPQDPYLFSRPAHPTLVDPRGSVMADLDGDGRKDLVSSVGLASSPTSIGISIQRATSNGLARAALAPTGVLTDDVLVHDVSGEGFADVIASKQSGEAHEAIALPGFGDGTLGEPIDLPFPAYRDLALGRFTPGRPGAVVATDEGLRLWRSPVAFDFVADQMLGSVAANRLLAVDLDGNGIDEVVAAEDERLVLFRNLTQVASVNLNFAVGLKAADVNGDGVDEALVTSSGGEVKAFGSSLNVVRSVVPTTTGVQAAAGDLDGDGQIDIVRANEAPSLTVAFATGVRKDVPIAKPAIDVFVADATGDGEPDLLAVERGPSMVEVVEGDGGGGFSAQRATVSTNTNGWSTRTADFNNDGKLDVIAAQLNNLLDGYTVSSTATVLLGNGSGSFTRAGTVSTQGSSTGIDVGDVNGDGKADVVVSDYHSGTVSQYLGNGDGTFGERIFVPTCPLNDAVVVGNFNGDAYADAAAACRGTVFQQTLSIYLGSPAGLAPGATLGVSHSNTAWGFRLGDINGDAKQDILLDSNQSFKPCAPPCTLISSSYDGPLTYFLGLGNGLFEPQAREYIVGRTIFDTWIADVNGDGRGDVITTIPYDDQVQVAQGKADGSLGTPYSIDTLEYPVGVRTADMTGDGELDLVLTHGPTMVSVTPGRGDGTFGDPTAYVTRGATGEPALGRFDADVRTDVFVPEGGVGELLLQGS